MSFKNINRRGFLKSTAAAVGASSVSMSMVQQALANNPNVKRLIVWYTPEGCAQEAFWPKQSPGSALNINMNAKLGGGGVAGRNNSILGYASGNMGTYCLQPLKKHEKDICLVSGFKNNGDTSISNDHKGKMAGALTGGKPREGSIDQLVAKEIQGSSPERAIYSPVYGQHTHARAPDDFLSPVRLVGGGTTGNPFWNPVYLFNQLFPNGIDNGGMVSNPDGSLPFTKRHGDLAVLDAMEQRLEQIKCVGGVEARNKYETLYKSYAQLKKNVEGLIKADEDLAKSGGGANVNIDIPNNWIKGASNPKHFGVTKSNEFLKSQKLYWNVANNFEKLVDISIDTTVAAFAMDRTRVSTLQFSGTGGDHNPAVNKYHYATLGLNLETSDVNDHALTHDTNGPKERDQARIFRWYYSKLSELVTKLKATPDSNGGTLFDSTVIITASEFSMRNHRTNDMPYMIISGSNSNFKRGVYLDARQGGNFSKHASFFHGVMEGMGVRKNRFGDSNAPYRGILS